VVTDANDNPVPGVTVNWTPATGDGSATPSSSQTNAQGVASTSWTLGSTAGDQTLTAGAGSLSVTFNATASVGGAANIEIWFGD
jgi:hypothetical protein